MRWHYIYGDGTPTEPPVPWEEFEYTEYLFRLEGLLEQYHSSFAASLHPFNPNPDEAHRAWERCREKLEETALEFAAYSYRLRMEAD